MKTRPARLKNLTQLGSKTIQYHDQYNPSVLEAFPNKNPEGKQWVSLICPEFTSLCPITGQPDFARIFINYIPNQKLVESKALKLYLFSFRNQGDFHEDCVETICCDLNRLMKPHFIEVIGEFTPRGGIAIYPYSSSSDGSAVYKKLLLDRKAAYAPGKYTMGLGKPYA